MIKHSIVSWDSCFRSFFHLLPSLAKQDYDLSQVEFIFVEQRSKALAQQYADAYSVQSFEQIAKQLNSPLHIKSIYLDESIETPYHPGRLLNAGLKVAQGDILSTMDIDILVPNNFLHTLDKIHDLNDPVVACIFRHTADRPCGVPASRWIEQIVDYDLILNTCPDKHAPVPTAVGNKAPLLSTRKEYWEKINYYDEHPIFSTAYTLFGRDISMRFNLLLGDVELPLPIAALHPWHPTEVNRGQDKIQMLYQVQQTAIEWSKNEKCYDVAQRNHFSELLYQQYRNQLDDAIRYSEKNMFDSTLGCITDKQ